MFCTNCGKDCTGYRFCPDCGTQIVDTQTPEETFPEPGTEAFEARRAMLNRRRIPHCPECLNTHIATLPFRDHGPYKTKHVCRWCGYEWHPRGKTKIKEPSCIM